MVLIFGPKHFYFETLLVCYFVPENVSFDSEKELNNYVPRLGNYKISYNVFSGTGAKNGGIAHINMYIHISICTYICVYIYI